MRFLCDFCGEQRSIIYCQSDSASLCLSCDRNIHSANALSKRHSRTLVCERCNSQPAFVRCIEERISLCQNCDWMAHVVSNIIPVHKRQAVNCYTGCPSAAELSATWSFLLDSPSARDVTCEQRMGLMTITENRPGDDQGPLEKSDLQNAFVAVKAGDLDNVDVNKSTFWMESSTPLLDPKLQSLVQPAGSYSSSMPKALLSQEKEPVVFDKNTFHGDFVMDEVDLNFENYEELFGVALNAPEQLLDTDGIHGLFGTKDMPCANRHRDYTAEVSSVGGLDVMQPACSNASADSVVSCHTEPTLCFTRQAQLGLSFPCLTGENSIRGDYQDCGASSMLITGGPPWCPPPLGSTTPSSTRNDAIMRYREKRKTRKFGKKVRYASRKARADVRKRVNGRFVKAGDAYDYDDPASQTRSY